MSRQTISPEVVAESMRIAKANQVPGQTKEQTQLIAQGIQKGIAEYKRNQKARQRAANKAKKQELRQRGVNVESDEIDSEEESTAVPSQRYGYWLPWFLLLMTWSWLLWRYLMT